MNRLQNLLLRPQFCSVKLDNGHDELSERLPSLIEANDGETDFYGLILSGRSRRARQEGATARLSLLMRAGWTLPGI